MKFHHPIPLGDADREVGYAGLVGTAAKVGVTALAVPIVAGAALFLPGGAVLVPLVPVAGAAYAAWLIYREFFPATPSISDETVIIPPPSEGKEWTKYAVVGAVVIGAAAAAYTYRRRGGRLFRRRP